MDLIQPITKYLIEPVLARREGSDHLRELAALEESQYFSRTQIQEIQLERLRRLLIHARDHCPFYAERFASGGFEPTRLASLDDIKVIPPIRKSDIQRHTAGMIADNYAKEALVTNQTGGSTGAPLKFYHNRERLFSRKATTYRHDRWAGWDIGRKMGVLWGNRVDFGGAVSSREKLRKALHDRRLILDTSNITAELFADFYKALKEFRPTVYLAYANAMFLFARYLKEKGHRDYHRPKGIITSAELLTDEQRTLIEEVFGCPVFNRYGCRETSLVASECSEHRGLHQAAEHLLMQIERPSSNPEAPGKIILTDLSNFGQPLIRYQIEDMGVWGDESCPCGRGLPLMKLVGGRVTDFLVTPEGKIVSGAAMTIYFVASVPGVSQAQLVQKTRSNLLLRVIRGDNFGDSSRQMIEKKVREFFGPSMTWELEFVDSLPTTASGKHRFSISDIDPMEYLV